jgi:hypothetical protein
MRKISFISLIAVMSLPAFAAGSVHEMYGKEPVSQEVVAQYEKQFGKAEENVLVENKDALKTEDVKEDADLKKVEKAEETQKPKEVEEIKKVKEIKEVEVKEVKKEEPAKEVSETKEAEYEAPSDPNAKFPRGLQFGIGASATSGMNGFIGYNNKKLDSFWGKRFGIRLDFASFSPIKKDFNKELNKDINKEGGIEIDDTLKIDNVAINGHHYGAMVDFYPFGDTWFLGGFRVSGGYMFGKLDLDANVHGLPDDNGYVEFEMNHHKYYYTNGEMSAKAMADWKYNGPYVGTGFDLGLFWGFKIYFDAGVVLTGNTAKFDMNIPTDYLENANGDSIVEGTAAYDQYVTDREKELSDARKEIKDYPYYPLVKLGFMYRF